MSPMTGPSPTGVGPRAGTAAEWASSPLILRPGEVGVESDTGVEKYGNGTDLWPALPAGGGGSTVTTPNVGLWGDHAIVSKDSINSTEWERVEFVPDDVANPDSGNPLLWLLDVNDDGDLVVAKSGLYALSLTGSAASAVPEGIATINCLAEDESLVYYQTNFDLDAQDPNQAALTNLYILEMTNNAFLPWGNAGGIGPWAWFTYLYVAFTEGQVLKTFVSPGTNMTSFQVTYDIFPVLYF